MGVANAKIRPSTAATGEIPFSCIALQIAGVANDDVGVGATCDILVGENDPAIAADRSVDDCIVPVRDGDRLPGRLILLDRVGVTAAGARQHHPVKLRPAGTVRMQCLAMVMTVMMLVAVMELMMTCVMRVALMMVMTARGPDWRAFVEIAVAGAGVEARELKTCLCGRDAPTALADRPDEVGLVIGRRAQLDSRVSVSRISVRRVSVRRVSVRRHAGLPM